MIQIHQNKLISTKDSKKLKLVLLLNIISLLVTQYNTKGINVVRKTKFTRITHSAMGDTLPSMMTKIPQSNGNLKFLDKGKIILIDSQTNISRNTILEIKMTHLRHLRSHLK